LQKMIDKEEKSICYLLKVIQFI